VPRNAPYYGENLELLRKKFVPEESVDLASRARVLLSGMQSFLADRFKATMTGLRRAWRRCENGKREKKNQIRVDPPDGQFIEHMALRCL
jgi:hypothetical protein